MRGRSGFSLVEMVIVLVLAGLVSTAAITMFSSQNRLNAAMTALGESQENARSAVRAAATELRAVTNGGIVVARSDRVVVRVPILMGIVCAVSGSGERSVYVPLDGRVFDLSEEIDGYGLRDDTGSWATGVAVGATDGFRGSESRQPCLDAGTGDAGEDGDYATILTAGEIGDAVQLYREVTYSFGTSGLHETRRAFFRARGGNSVELAQGFSNDSRLEYWRESQSQWVPAVAPADLADITRIRLVTQVSGAGRSGLSTGTARFSLMREVPLRNAR